MKRIVGFILTFTVATLIVFASLLWLLSPGKPRPILDANGNVIPNSLSEKIWVNINGIEQGMFVRSTNIAHPLLLHLHGGPGMPTYFLEQKYPT
ncbi:MAG: alpha/beta hydrolase, partial [Casimicrobium sp.]